jgi:hypothetical protein
MLRIRFNSTHFKEVYPLSKQAVGSSHPHSTKACREIPPLPSLRTSSTPSVTPYFLQQKTINNKAGCNSKKLSHDCLSATGRAKYLVSLTESSWNYALFPSTYNPVVADSQRAEHEIVLPTALKHSGTYNGIHLYIVPNTKLSKMEIDGAKLLGAIIEKVGTVFGLNGSHIAMFLDSSDSTIKGFNDQGRIFFNLRHHLQKQAGALKSSLVADWFMCACHEIAHNGLLDYADDFMFNYERDNLVIQYMTAFLAI